MIWNIENNISNLENDDISKYNTSIFKRGIFWKSEEMINNDQPFIKFIHTSLPFWNITKGIEHLQPLTELEIAWRDQNGDKYSLIDDIFLENDISDQFIPSPGGKSGLPNLRNQTIIKEKQSKDIKYNLNSKIESTLSNEDTRNRKIDTKHRSLMKPTPIKNHKLLSQKGDDSEDEVISEMRSLNVRPINKDIHSLSYTTRRNTARAKTISKDWDLEVIITEVEMKTKRKLIRWLEDINLIRRKAVGIKEFPQFCRNGVIFFDLVNKLQGRNPTLQGVQRNPKNIACITANFAKVLSFLRKFPKMNARYLWAQNYMMEGNWDVIWGFIDDVWYWHNNKMSPNDTSKPRFNQNKSKNKTECLNSSTWSFGKENN